MKKLSLLFACFVLISGAAFCKSKLFPGYYITNNGDSVKCNIDFGDWNRNPTSITVFIGNEKKVLTVADSRGFGIFGYNDYITAAVTYHPGTIAGTLLPSEYQEKVQSVDCFLKVLVRGKYSLYQLVTTERPYYFESENNGAFSELVYRVRQQENRIDEDPQYRKTLFNLFVQEGSSDRYFTKINGALYNGSDLEKLFELLNEGQPGTQKTITRGKAIQLDIYGGAVLANFPSSFNGLYATGNKFGSAISPSFGANLLFTFPNRFKSFALGISSGYFCYSKSLDKTGSIAHNISANYYYTTDYTEKLIMKNSVLMTDLYAQYYLNHFSKTRFYVKGGLAVNISLNSNTDINSDYTISTTGVQNGNIPISEGGSAKATAVSLRKSFLAFHAGAGVAKGRSRLEASYYLDPGQLSLTQGTTFKIGLVGLYYYFAVLK